MGLIRAAINAAKGTLRDQYKEFIYCEALPMNVLIRKGQKRAGEGNTNRGNDNIISDGSAIAVADGQCLLIVEQGNIVDFCAEPGEYVYNTGTSPSLLTGGMDGLKGSFKTLLGRVQAGGQADKDQRVYFVNMKEIMGNKVGAGDIPFRDSEFNFTMKLKCFGEYSYKITDPLMFYKNVSGNVTSEFTRDKIDSQFKAEIQTAIQPALGRIALKKIPYDQLTLFTKDIAMELNAELTAEWVSKRGISVESFALASVTPDAESAKKIEQFQSSRVYTDARMMGARLGEAQANAMETAAGNEAGAMTGFLGMGFAQQAGGMNAAQLFQMGGQPQGVPQPQPVPQPVPVAPEKPTPTDVLEEGWTCGCGVVNSGKFCVECGGKAPEIEIIETPKADTWSCSSCNTENMGKFCMECGEKKPFVLDAFCESCGYEGSKPFKFCPECGSENKE